jgi:hypothetical protein
MTQHNMNDADRAAFEAYAKRGNFLGKDSTGEYVAPATRWICAAWHEALAYARQQAPAIGTTLKLSELLRGLECGPAAGTFEPSQLFLLGQAIAEQAKKAPAIDAKQIRHEALEEAAAAIDNSFGRDNWGNYYAERVRALIDKK